MPANPSEGGFLNWVSLVATVAPVLFEFYRRAVANGSDEGAGAFAGGAQREDEGVLEVLRLSRSLAVTSFGVGFFSYVCMLDVTRHTLSDWIDLLASPGAARYYALLVSLFFLSRSTLFARRVPEYGLPFHAALLPLLALAGMGLMLALGWISAFWVGLWLVKARAGIVGWGDLPLVAGLLVLVLPCWLSSRSW